MNDSQILDESQSDWLSDILKETGLEKFYSKLAVDLQITKLSHFEFVTEEDLLQLGLSKPAAKRLLASIKKRKSFVCSLKSRIVNKLIPSFTFNSTSPANKFHPHHSQLTIDTTAYNKTNDTDSFRPNTEYGRLTCLINSQDIQIMEEIGNGVHGFVKKGEWTTPNGRVVEVALKILRKDVMSEPGASFNDFVKEISVMHQLNHSNIIKLYGVVLSSPMMMVTELAPFGNLRDKLRKENGCTPISQLINFGVQIAAGMQYLESKRFVHRDLAARNIFISHGRKILIGDLGLMRALSTQDNHYVMSERTKIPFPWCAPESLKFKQFSSLSDVYMFSVTLWEMFSFGKEPWAGMNLNDILSNISSQNTRLPCPEACPSMVYQTLLQCWNTDPASRPNFLTLYQYLSTSYPLEIRSNQTISELSEKCANEGLVFNDFTNDASSSDSKSIKRKVLNCNIEDRILVIEGQPEKYWWKGQNQRTFEIGWFPLSATRWVEPKKAHNHISKPLKNSFVHTGHCGPNGKWGNPKFIDSMYLKNPLKPDDMNDLRAIRTQRSQVQIGSTTKGKAISRLSKFFGICESSKQHNQLMANEYKKFSNETPITPKLKENPRPFIRSQSEEFTNQTISVDNSAPLIYFDDDAPMIVGTASFEESHPQESIMDMDHKFNLMPVIDQRRASDTKIDRIEDTYHRSCAGSWNTGTFYGSNGDIYSNYYCPQDAAEPSTQSHQKAMLNDLCLQSTKNDRYYTAVEDVTKVD